MGKYFNKELLAICVLLEKASLSKENLELLEKRLNKNNLSLKNEDGTYKDLLTLFDELHQKFCNNI